MGAKKKPAKKAAKKPKAKKKKKKKKKKAKKKKKKKKKKKAKKVKYVGGKRAKGQHKSKASIAAGKKLAAAQKAKGVVPLQEVDVLCGPRGDHGLEEHDAPRGGQGRLGVHQEEQAQQRPQPQGGRQDLRRRLDVQARGRHEQAHEVSALGVSSACRGR